MSRRKIFSSNKRNKSQLNKPHLFIRSPYARRLCVEALEDRRMLATFSVTNLLDGPVAAAGDLPGSLRQAVFDANAIPGADEITFGGAAVSGTVALSEGELLVNDSLTISGPGQELLTIDAQQNSRVLRFVASGGDLTIRGLTLTNGLSSNEGGGVFFNSLGSSAGTFTLASSTLSGSTSSAFMFARGGGIYALGNLAISDSNITENRAYASLDPAYMNPFETRAYGGGIYTSGGTVTISDSSITNNEATSDVSHGVGSGLYAASDLSITSSSVTGNTSTSLVGGYGAITIAEGFGANTSASITGSTISGNVGHGIQSTSLGNVSITITDTEIASNQGTGVITEGSPISLINSSIYENSDGGIWQQNGGDVTLTGSTIYGNLGRGGIYNSFSPGQVSSFPIDVTLTSSTIRDNTSFTAGGGIRLGQGLVQLTDSTISGNISSGKGGGIYTMLAEISINQSTISGNRGSNMGAGGIHTASGPTSITSSTVTANHNGGVRVDDTTVNPGITIHNSIVADNNPAPNPNFVPTDITVDPDSISNLTHNLIGNADGLTLQPSDENIVGTAIDPRNPFLSPLADNDGPTQTHLPLPNSPAINAGDPIIVDGEDQRGSGFPRVQFDAVDIGSVELQDVDEMFFFVNDPSDVIDFTDENVTLREAISTANIFPGEDTILFDPSISGETITLIEGEIPVVEGLVLDASTVSSNITIDAQQLSRVFNFTAPIGDFEFSKLDLANGQTTGDGGAVFFGSNGTLRIDSTSIRNSSANRGGGIFAPDGTLLFTNSTINGNSSNFEGGGLRLGTGSVSLTNSTVSSNSSGTTGGGIHSEFGAISLLSSTLTLNASTGSGGAIFIPDTAQNPSVTINSTIVAENTDNGGMANDIVIDPDGSLTVNYSLLGVADGLLIAGDVANSVGTMASPLNPMLGPLADNGGFTQTHLLLVGSPAINAGDPSLTLEYDQRGEPAVRSFDIAGGTGPDIGSIEVQTVEPSRFVVNSTQDTSSFSDAFTTLREAIAFARISEGPDVITFDPVVFDEPKEIDLQHGQLFLSDTLTIDALGSSSGVTIDARFKSSAIQFGGDSGDLTLVGVTVKNASGRGFANRDGIDFRSDGTATLINSVVTNNAGRGIRTSVGDVILMQSSISHNRNGGIRTTSGDVTVRNSLVSDNSSLSSAGGVRTHDGDIAIVLSTISGNRTNLFGFDGGGVTTSRGNISIVSSTITKNSSHGAGGGILVSSNYSTTASLTISSSIIAGNVNVSALPPDITFDSTGTLAINRSLIGVADGLPTIAGNIGNLTGTFPTPLDPLLGALADNGGPTLTHELLEGSPAINSGSSAEEHDQRGLPFARNDGGGVDIGAYERQSLNLVVDTVSDSSDGDFTENKLSIREAIELSNVNPGTDSITFDTTVFGAPRVITLNQGELLVTESVDIDATLVEGEVTLDALGQSRVLNISAPSGDFSLAGLTLTGGNRGAVRFSSSNASQLNLNESVISGNTNTGKGAGIFAYYGEVQISDSTISNNNPTASSGGGAGIYSLYADLILNNVTVTGNTSVGSGGGLGTISGAISISNSVVSANSSAASGGGIYSSTGNVNIVQSTVSDNDSAELGGGVYVNNAATTISNSTFGNNMSGGNGGGLAVEAGSISVANSTLSNNSSSASGGGVYIETGTVDIQASTLNHNISTDSGGAVATNSASVLVTSSTLSSNESDNTGGAIKSTSGDVTISHSTVFNNQAATSGGGILIEDSAENAALAVSNTIVAGNTLSDTAPNDIVADPDGILQINYSLLGVADSLSTITNDVGNLSGTLLSPLDPVLGTLAANGGATSTHALLPFSPALNAGDPGIDSGTDQRGNSRVQFKRADIGAFEFQAEIPSQGLEVSTTDDVLDFDLAEGQLSLREAVLIAEDVAGNDAVTFASELSGQIIILNDGELELSEAASIDASALSEPITVDAQLASRIFNIVATSGDFMLANLRLQNGFVGENNLNTNDATFSGGAIRSVTEGLLTIDNTTIRDSSTGGDFASGGGIFSTGPLKISNALVTGNSTSGTSAHGGGIFGDVELVDSTVSHNTIAGNNTYGGGVAGTNLVISQSQVVNNRIAVGTTPSSTRGGGIFAWNSLTLLESSVSDNVLNGGQSHGGGIATPDASGGSPSTTIDIQRSTISGNSANYGGGVDSAYSLFAENSTISGNVAVANGGGIRSSGSLHLSHTTVTHNQAGIAGGLEILNPSNSPEISSTILADNISTISNPDLLFPNNVIPMLSYSLVGDSRGTTLTASSLDPEGNIIGPIPGPSNIEATTVSIEIAAIGDFENGLTGGATEDRFLIEYSLDGQPFQPLFVGSVDESDNNEYELENGNVVFYNDPLLVNGVKLTNQFQEFNATIPDIGNTLVLQLTAETNGVTEAIAFKNIQVTNAVTQEIMGRAIADLPDIVSAPAVIASDFTLSNQMFGIRNAIDALPATVRDDSITIPTDQFGIIRSTDKFDFFGIVDTENPENSGPLLADWTFALNAAPIDPLLGFLQDNGGPTFTHSLLESSPAIEAGDPTIVGSSELIDQRGEGFARVIGERLDIGAVEFTPISADFDSDGDVDGSDFLQWQRGFGTSDAERFDGDSDGNRRVDSLDLSVWTQNYGTRTVTTELIGAILGNGQFAVNDATAVQAVGPSGTAISVDILRDRATRSASEIDQGLSIPGWMFTRTVLGSGSTTLGVNGLFGFAPDAGDAPGQTGQAVVNSGSMTIVSDMITHAFTEGDTLRLSYLLGSDSFGGSAPAFSIVELLFDQGTATEFLHSFDLAQGMGVVVGDQTQQFEQFVLPSDAASVSLRFLLEGAPDARGLIDAVELTNTTVVRPATANVSPLGTIASSRPLSNRVEMSTSDGAEVLSDMLSRERLIDAVMAIESNALERDNADDFFSAEPVLDDFALSVADEAFDLPKETEEQIDFDRYELPEPHGIRTIRAISDDLLDIWKE